MKKLHIAIIGAGTAGLATAIICAQQQIRVSIFEKSEKLDPVGAGLLLQPAGLAVFEHLGVLDHALALGAQVTGLEGQLANGQLLVNSHYHQADPKFYGLGIHRASLCHVLQSRLKDYADLVQWHMHTDVTHYAESGAEVRLYARHQQHNFDASFDALFICNGAKSQLRPPAWVKVDQAYPWGAAWRIVPECTTLDPQILHQFYDRSQIMMGILPTGAVPTQPQQRLSSVFWSLPSEQLSQFMSNKDAHSAWLQQVAKRWKPAADGLAQVMAAPEQSSPWLTAHYRDVVMSKFGLGRVGVLGDAAHAMSPQLGQGANMALLDAWALGQALHVAQKNQTLDCAMLWQHYHQQRQTSTAFYQFLSRLLTPLYQSDHFWAGPLRDLSFAWMYRVPYFRKQMAFTISGLKTGMLSQLSYQQIAQREQELQIKAS